MTKNAEKKARAMLSRLSLEQLIKEFDMTEDMPASFETSMVRGGSWTSWRKGILRRLISGSTWTTQRMKC